MLSLSPSLLTTLNSMTPSRSSLTAGFSGKDVTIPAVDLVGEGGSSSGLADPLALFAGLSASSSSLALRLSCSLLEIGTSLSLPIDDENRWFTRLLEERRRGFTGLPSAFGAMAWMRRK